MVVTLMFSTFFSPLAQAQVAEDKNDAITSSTYYSIKTHEIVLNEQEVLSKDSSITNQEIDQVKQILEALTDEEIDEILVQNGYSLETLKIDTDSAHANIVWYVPVIIIGLLVAGALIFSALYFNHKEKMNFVNKCYDHSGYPQIDSRDKAGLNGTTNSGEAAAAGGYTLECRKK